MAILVVIAALAISTSALANGTQYTGVAVYLLDDQGQWLNPPDTDLGLHARAFISAGHGGICDKEVWTENFTNHATVSQWINYSFGGTRWDWQIRKPGTFAADCIEFHIQSNDDVAVAFSGFADLAPLVHTDQPAIPTSYGFGDPPLTGATDAPPSTWLAADALNGAGFNLAYDDIKGGLTKKLWTKIDVDETTRACDYEDQGTITLTLTDVKYFINPANGQFNESLPNVNPEPWIS
jgi:hypothetical protein